MFIVLYLYLKKLWKNALFNNSKLYNFDKLCRIIKSENKMTRAFYTQRKQFKTNLICYITPDIQIEIALV